MRGEELTVKEIINLNNKFVFIKPILFNVGASGKAKVLVKDNGIYFYPLENGHIKDMPFISGLKGLDINTGKWLNVYEWIEN